MRRRVVVTGLGLVTAVGNDVPSTWRALMNCESGADYISRFDVERFSVKFACEVKGFDPLSFLDKKEARRMGAFTHFAMAASDEAELVHMVATAAALDDRPVAFRYPRGEGVGVDMPEQGVPLEIGKGRIVVEGS